MKKFAAEFHRENVAANKAGNRAKKARAALYALMKSEGVKSFDLTTNVEGRDLSLGVEVSASERTLINVAELRRIVSEEQFLQAISATKTAVEEVAGKDVAMRVSYTETGTENVSVKPKK